MFLISCGWDCKFSEAFGSSLRLTLRMVSMYTSFELEMQTNVVSGDLDCKEVTARFIAGCCAEESISEVHHH